MMSHDPSDAAPPPGRLILRGAGTIGDWIGFFLRAPLPVAPDRGRGRTVMVLPGFLTVDMATAPLRRTLARAGYRPVGWGLGWNRGLTAGLIERLEARVAAAGAGRPIALIGWSLGGIFAREIAKRRPELVERVITLGSPFSGDPRANNVWRVYEFVAGHPVDAPPIERHPATKPPVPTFALWSRQDGLIAPAAARGLPGETDAAIEVHCRHTSFLVDPEALRTILDLLDRPA